MLFFFGLFLVCVDYKRLFLSYYFYDCFIGSKNYLYRWLCGGLWWWIWLVGLVEEGDYF